MKTIAIVDDDADIGNLMQEILERAGYACLRAYSGTEAVLLFQHKKPDLTLLDLNLPGLSGEEVLKTLKGLPVIIVSARVEVEDKVKLLLAGAVDYITKPFDSKELLARIEVQLRRGQQPAEDTVLTVNELKLYTESHEFFVNGTQVFLTKTEFAILKLLMRNKDHVVSKSVILDRICEDTPDCTDSSLKQHISNLRKKLREASKDDRDYIEAVWGIGFRLNA